MTFWAALALAAVIVLSVRIAYWLGFQLGDRRMRDAALAILAQEQRRTDALMAAAQAAADELDRLANAFRSPNDDRDR